MHEHGAGAGHRHDHDDGDGHSHDHAGSELSEMELRVRALESLLVEKGYVDPAALDMLIETYETKVGPQTARGSSPRHGATRSTDSGFSTMPARRSPRLATRAGRASTWSRSKTRQRVHNMVVCTLVLVLSVAGAGPAAGLVQVRALSFARGHRSARRTGGFRRDAGRRRRGSRVGFDCRDPLSGLAGAAARHRRLDRRSNSQPWSRAIR